MTAEGGAEVASITSPGGSAQCVIYLYTYDDSVRLVSLHYPAVWLDIIADAKIELGDYCALVILSTTTPPLTQSLVSACQ